MIWLSTHQGDIGGEHVTVAALLVAAEASVAPKAVEPDAIAPQTS